MENVKNEKVIETEQELLKGNIAGGKLRVFIWEDNANNIPDSEELKLVILKTDSKEAINNILTSKGQVPRVYRNTLFFLYPLESERPSFVDTVKRKVAYEYIERDKNLNLSEEQKKEVKQELKRVDSGQKESVRRLYRMLSIPSKEGSKETDLGIPTYGEEKSLDEEVYERLRSSGEILEKVAPLFLREKYLSSREYVNTEQLYQSALKTPGETRVINKMVLEQGIIEGVSIGLFGLGELEDDKPICRYFKEQPSIAFSESEVIISEALCYEQKKAEPVTGVTPYPPTEPGTLPEIAEKEVEWEKPGVQAKLRDRVALRFQVPKGKVANIMGVMNLLQSKFESLEIELTASGGEITEQDYEDKIKETFRQLGIETDEG